MLDKRFSAAMNIYDIGKRISELEFQMRALMVTKLVSSCKDITIVNCLLISSLFDLKTVEKFCIVLLLNAFSK